MPQKSNFVYCDGACSGNPGPGGWGCLIVSTADEVVEFGGFESDTTNNKMELTAALQALTFLEKGIGDIVLITDSQYLIKGITEWIKGWIKKNWINSQREKVANQNLWEALHEKVNSIENSGRKIKWTHVRGHQGDVGNERVDKIAVAFSLGKSVNLFSGMLDEYPYKLNFPN